MTGSMQDMKLTGSVLQSVEAGISAAFISATFIWLLWALTQYLEQQRVLELLNN